MKKRHWIIVLTLYGFSLYFFIMIMMNHTTNYIDFFTQKHMKNYEMEKIFEGEDRNHYVMNIVLDPENRVYTIKQSTLFKNKSNNILKDIYFHVYPNVFKDKKNPPYTLLKGYDFEPGDFKIQKLWSEDKRVSYHIDKSQPTILQVHMDRGLRKDEWMKINLEYEIKLPKAYQRFGYYDRTYNFGNAYAILAVYDEKWHLEPYTKIGDPFYSEVSDYDVSIQAPKEFEVASSGKCVHESIDGAFKTWKFKGNKIRDFAFVASKSFIQKTKMMDNIKLKGYFVDQNDKIHSHALEVAANAIKIFSEVFGKYPYDTYTLVEADIVGGMEYPTLAMIDDEIYESNMMDRLERVIVHEMAHQWWYGVVGNNEITDAWLDEGLATYSEYVYFKKRYGKEVGEKYYKNYIYAYYERYKDLESDEKIKKDLQEFHKTSGYRAIVYKKSAMLLYNMEKEYGETAMENILKSYYDAYGFKNADTHDFIKICEKIIKKPLKLKIDEWIGR